MQLRLPSQNQIGYDSPQDDPDNMLLMSPVSTAGS
jgi:hypothetical protein